MAVGLRRARLSIEWAALICFAAFIILSLAVGTLLKPLISPVGGSGGALPSNEVAVSGSAIKTGSEVLNCSDDLWRFELNERSIWCTIHPSNPVDVPRFTGSLSEVALLIAKWVYGIITYSTDAELFNVSQYVMSVDEVLGIRRGDCEDMALLTAYTMLENGFREVYILYVRFREGGAHVDAGLMINGTYYLVPVTRYPYLMRLNGDYCNYWLHLKGLHIDNVSVYRVSKDSVSRVGVVSVECAPFPKRWALPRGIEEGVAKLLNIPLDPRLKPLANTFLEAGRWGEEMVLDAVKPLTYPDAGVVFVKTPIDWFEDKPDDWVVSRVASIAGSYLPRGYASYWLSIDTCPIMPSEAGRLDINPASVKLSGVRALCISISYGRKLWVPNTTYLLELEDSLRNMLRVNRGLTFSQELDAVAEAELRCVLNEGTFCWRLGTAGFNVTSALYIYRVGWVREEHPDVYAYEVMSYMESRGIPVGYRAYGVSLTLKWLGARPAIYVVLACSR